MAAPPLWVYKCNANEHSYAIATGDWDRFFAGPQPGEWGGSTTMASPASLDILWNRMQVGDLALCWQTNRRRAVGLCRVHSFDDWTDDHGDKQRDMWLGMLGEPFSPPVNIYELKKQDPRLASVRALQSGYISTLYETTPAEARTLLRTCRILPQTLSRLQSSSNRGAAPPAGAGFGSPADNRKVEAAAVKALVASYTAKGWKLTDRQKDNVGYDFEAEHGSMLRHIELKGPRGPMPSFPITEHEVATARFDPLWRLAVVTDALSAKPRLQEWNAADFLSEFTFRPLSHMARRK
jgi:Domain of unknown function (DUF3883)